MANDLKYENVVWGEDSSIVGEMMATNAYYTGEHIGTVMQDAATNAYNEPHFAESTTFHNGTIMGDAVDENFPVIQR